MPMTLGDVYTRLVSAAVERGSADPAADALRQWVNCGLVIDDTAGAEFFLPTNSSDLTGLPFPPELCHYISTGVPWVGGGCEGGSTMVLVVGWLAWLWQ